MIRYYFEEGIILKHQKIRDADLLLTIYGRSKGKYSVIAPGALNIKNRLRGRVEPISFGKGYFVKRRSLDLLINWEVKEIYWEIREDLRKLDLAFFLVNSVDRMMPLENPDDKVFSLLTEALDLIKENFNPNFKEIFLLKLLQSQGLLAEFSLRCGKCGKIFEDKDFIRIDVSENKAFCEKCSLRGPLISLNSLENINKILKFSLEELKDLHLSSDFQEVVRQYEKYNLQEEKSYVIFPEDNF